MRRTIAVITAAILTASAGPALADEADTTVGRVSVPDRIFAEDTCVDVPVSYDFSDVPADSFWTLDLDADFDTGAFAAGFGGETGHADAYWCPSDLPGEFTLSGMLEVMDAESTGVTQDRIVLNFVVTKRRTTATFRVSDRTPRVRQIIRAKGCVSSSGHRDDYREVILQYRRAGEWRRLMKTWTDEVGCFNEETYSKTTGTARLRARVPGTSSRTGAYSKVVAVKVHR